MNIFLVNYKLKIVGFAGFFFGLLVCSLAVVLELAKNAVSFVTVQQDKCLSTNDYIPFALTLSSLTS